MSETFAEDKQQQQQQQQPPPPSPIPPLPQQPQQPRPIAGKEITTSWQAYLNSLNAKYQDKIVKIAQVPDYKLHFKYRDGREETAVFTRMKLLQWQVDELDDLRGEATDLATDRKNRAAIQALSSMYRKAASYILFNRNANRPMTEEEYSSSYFDEVRPVLDAAMLITLTSDPN